MSGFEVTDIAGGLVLLGGYAILIFTVPLPVRRLDIPFALLQSFTFLILSGIFVRTQHRDATIFYVLMGLLQIHVYLVAPALHTRWPGHLTLPRWFQQAWMGRGVGVATALGTALAGIYILCRWVWAMPVPGGS